MSGMFGNFTNVKTTFTPSQFSAKYPPMNQNEKIQTANPNKPYEILGPDGNLKGYFWYKGNSIDLVFNLKGGITLEAYEQYVSIEDVLSYLDLTATFYNFRHEKIVQFDTFMDADYPLVCNLVYDENGCINGTTVTVSIDKELSNTKFVKGIYYLDLIASHPNGYCETLFGQDTCTFEVR